MATPSKWYIKTRLIYFMDRRVELIDELNTARKQPSFQEWQYVDQMIELSGVESSIDVWKKRWDEYQPPQLQSWKDDVRYVCHIEIPEEYES